MNIQRKFYSLLVNTLFAIPFSLVLSIASVQAQENAFVEGVHYELLDTVQPVQTGDKIEVVEMFWYKCPHCFRLEPFIVEWQKNIPDNVQYVPIPALLGKNWEFDARAYYTFVSLGVIEQLHGKFFLAIHEEKRVIDSVEKLADWAARNGVQRESVIDAFTSFAVENKINFAKVMTRKYGISGVPAIIVDGRYKTAVSQAGSQSKLIEVIDFLIEKSIEVRAN